jgi:hypothetical protein
MRRVLPALCLPLVLGATTAWARDQAPPAASAPSSAPALPPLPAPPPAPGASAPSSAPAPAPLPAPPASASAPPAAPSSSPDVLVLRAPSLATHDAPTLESPPPRARKFYESGWFWAAMGAAAILGGAIYLATQDTGSPTIHLQVQVPH